MQNKNPTKVHCKQEIKTKQHYDKKKTPKTGVQQTKGNEEFNFYLYPLGT